MKTPEPHLTLAAAVLVLGATLVVSSGRAWSESTVPRFPSVEGDSLSKRHFGLPQDLPGERTLILIAFEARQQRELDTWIEGLQLGKASAPWIETPVIDPPNAVFRWIIDSGMRRGLPDAGSRERTITLYTERKAFCLSMGMTSGDKSVYVAVVNRSGNVLAMADGSYSASKAAPLLEAWLHQ
jgi:hypothetical protein